MYCLALILNYQLYFSQEATKHVVSKGLRATLQNRPVEVNENGKSDLETKQRFVLSVILLKDVLGQ